LTLTDTSKQCGVVWAVFYCILYEVKRLKFTPEQAMKA